LHYGFRKNTFQYDSILDESRRNFFGIRNDFLKDKSIAKVLLASTIQEKSELFDNFEFLEHSYIEPGTYNLIEIADFKEIEESTGKLQEKHSIQHHLDIISNKDITFNEKYVSIMIVLKSIYNLEIDLANKIAHKIYVETLKSFGRTIKHEDGSDLLPFDFFNNPVHSNGISNINEEEIKGFFKSAMMNYIESLTEYEKITTNMIVALDDFWLNYLNTTEEIRKGISLVTYINKNPIFEYKKACFDLFSSLIENFRNNALNYTL
jgi:preprotein translocase subunit SecA